MIAMLWTGGYQYLQHMALTLSALSNESTVHFNTSTITISTNFLKPTGIYHVVPRKVLAYIPSSSNPYQLEQSCLHCINPVGQNKAPFTYLHPGTRAVGDISLSTKCTLLTGREQGPSTSYCPRLSVIGTRSPSITQTCQ